MTWTIWGTSHLRKPPCIQIYIYIFLINKYIYIYMYKIVIIYIVAFLVVFLFSQYSMMTIPKKSRRARLSEEPMKTEALVHCHRKTTMGFPGFPFPVEQWPQNPSIIPWNPGWFSSGFPHPIILTYSNFRSTGIYWDLLGSKIPQLIINQQGFRSHCSVGWFPRRWNAAPCSL